MNRRAFLKAGSLAAPAFAAGFSAPDGAAGRNSAPVRMGSYASEGPLGYSTKTRWIETREGVFVIDAQWTLPEARNALAAMREDVSEKPLLGLLITHDHTDHYGGLSVFAVAFPDAPIFAARAITRSMREDTRGFNAMRRERHGETFPTQDVISAHLPTGVAEGGETVTLGGTRIWKGQRVEAGQRYRGNALELEQRLN
jgi:glyoxylase-like metal-dependent hydrolase (beta-lactamase superfamily II)